MKTKVVWFIAAFAIAPLFPLCYGQANQVDNRLGYNPGNTQTYTYSVTNPGQPQYNGTVQYGGPGAYTAGPAPARQPVVAQQPFNHGWLINRRFRKPREISRFDHNPQRSRKRRLFRAPVQPTPVA